jgi:hypothetical protein
MTGKSNMAHDLDISELIDIDALNKAAASGNRLVDRLKDYPVSHYSSKGQRFTIGEDHFALLQELKRGYERITGGPVSASPIIRRAIELAAEHMTELLLSSDNAEFREETDAFLKATHSINLAGR